MERINNFLKNNLKLIFKYLLFLVVFYLFVHFLEKYSYRNLKADDFQKNGEEYFRQFAVTLLAVFSAFLLDRWAENRPELNIHRIFLFFFIAIFFSAGLFVFSKNLMNNLTTKVYTDNAFAGAVSLVESIPTPKIIFTPTPLTTPLLNSQRSHGEKK